MAYIKEPLGIDFEIVSEKLTSEARKEISIFISNYKLENITKKAKSVISKTQANVAHS